MDTNYSYIKVVTTHPHFITYLHRERQIERRIDRSQLFINRELFQYVIWLGHFAFNSHSSE